MKFLMLMLVLLALSCQKEASQSTGQVELSNSVSTSSQVEDDFSDLKKKDDESCDDKTAEEIVQKEETKAVSLQGGTGSDCTVK